MFTFAHKAIQALAITGFFSFSHLAASNSTWVGGISNDLTDPANWTAGIPNSPLNIGTFDAAAFTHLPTLINTLTLSNMTFLPGSPSYVIDLNLSSLTVACDNGGIVNNSLRPQVFR